VVLACLLLFPLPAFGAEAVKIGVLAFRPKPQTLAQWQPLAISLKQALPSHDFVVEAYTYPELNEAIAQHRVDFVLTNPGHYVMLAESGGVSAPLATLAIKEAGQRASFFGGVIFTRVGQTAIATLEDLRGKVIASPSMESLGGYQAQAFEPSRLGIQLPRDCKLITTGTPHDTVVEAVLAGRAEVGFVRSGLLEGMARNGKVDLQQIKIINRQNPANFPVQVSTRLYPEWAFSSLPHVDEKLARHVASALFLWEEDSAATTAMGIHGFNIPANYGSVEALLRELRLPPFEAPPVFTLKDVWSRYRWQMYGALAVAGLIIWLLVRLQLSNRKLASEQRLVLLHQQQLRESEEAFRTVADYTYDWELWEDPGGAFRYCSPSCERITGYAPDAFKADPGLKERLLHPEDRAKWQAHRALVHAATEPEAAALRNVDELEFRLLRPDGEVRWIGHICHPIHDAAGRFRGHRLSNRDITERKQAEAAQQASEQMLQTVLDHFPGVVFWKDTASNYLGCNHGFALGAGLSDSADILQKSDFDLPWGATEAESYRADDRRVMDGNVAKLHIVETQHQADGSLLWLDTSKIPMRDREGQVIGVLGVSTDITELKRTEELLRQIEARQSAMIANIADVIAVISPGGINKYMSPNIEKYFGWKPEELVEKDTWRNIHPEDLTRIQGVFAMLLGEPDAMVADQCRYQCRDGSYKWMEFVAVNRVHDPDISGLLLNYHDVTERKEAEAALAQSEARYRAQFDLASEGIFSLSPAGVIVDVNAAFAGMHGYTRAEMMNMNLKDLDTAASSKLAPERMRRLLAGETLTFEVEHLHKDGHAFPMEVSASLVVSGGAPTMLCFHRDITERKQAEEEKAKLQAQLQQSQKMESLGTLAGGVAHDMNNVLGAILGLASAHIGTQPYGSPLHQALDTICKATERGGKMVKSLLSFAREGPAENHKLDLNAILREQVSLLERTTLATVRLQLDLEAELRPILGDASALTHAFMNLCVNAVDAMSENGTLTLHTRNVDNGWIEVEVEDNGTGMPKEVLEKALDPFFTTKEIGKGTGLGLSMVFSTVTAHRGQMAIESEPGQGTRVRLRFPAYEQEAPVQASAPAMAEEAVVPHGSLKVLLVDDDDLIQGSMQAIFEVLGHTAVTTALSGEEALALLEAGLEPDLVILDMNMPGLGGAGTLPRLRVLRPAVPVLLATGRVDQMALNLASAHPGVTLLSKPFGLRELQKHLESLGLG
jgi:PAS domain S-box-containing protein